MDNIDRNAPDYPERTISDKEILRIRDITKDQLCDILENNTKTLNNMVRKYNAVLHDFTMLQDENRELRQKNERLIQEKQKNERLIQEKQNGTGALVAILKAVADNNMQIHIEPRKVWDE